MKALTRCTLTALLISLSFCVAAETATTHGGAGGDARAEESNTLEFSSLSQQELNERLHLACHKGTYATVFQLIKYGANVNAWDVIWGNNALHWAFLSKSPDKRKILQLLANTGADFNAKNNYGLSPQQWMQAVEKATTDRAEAAADTEELLGLSQEDLDNRLLQACKDGNSKKVRVLIAQGANVNAQDENKYTPLHCACSNSAAPGKYKKVVSLLVNNNANVNTKTISGWTPLAMAQELAIIHCPGGRPASPPDLGPEHHPINKIIVLLKASGALA